MDNANLLTAVSAVFNALILLFMLRVWMQGCNVYIGPKYARFVINCTKHAVQFLGNKVTRGGLNLSAIAAIAILLVAKYSVEYGIFFDLPLEVLTSHAAYIAKPFLLCLKLGGALFLVIIFLSAILSWFSRGSELSQLCDQMLGPIYGELRRFIPPFGAIDITPLILIIAIQVADWLIAEMLAKIYSDAPGIVYFLWISFL